MIKRAWIENETLLDVDELKLAYIGDNKDITNWAGVTTPKPIHVIIGEGWADGEIKHKDQERSRYPYYYTACGEVLNVGTGAGEAQDYLPAEPKELLSHPLCKKCQRIIKRDYDQPKFIRWVKSSPKPTPPPLPVYYEDMATYTAPLGPEYIPVNIAELANLTRELRAIRYLILHRPWPSDVSPALESPIKAQAVGRLMIAIERLVKMRVAGEERAEVK